MHIQLDPSSISFSSYNRQHPMVYDATGNMYDPLEKYYGDYIHLLTMPRTIDVGTVKDLPISKGILASLIAMQYGDSVLSTFNSFMDDAPVNDRMRSDPVESIFDYMKLVNLYKTFVRERALQRDTASVTPPQPPQQFHRVVLGQLDDIKTQLKNLNI